MTICLVLPVSVVNFLVLARFALRMMALVVLVNTRVSTSLVLRLYVAFWLN